jgi:hypothetical protein
LNVSGADSYAGYGNGSRLGIHYPNQAVVSIRNVEISVRVRRDSGREIELRAGCCTAVAAIALSPVAGHRADGLRLRGQGESEAQRRRCDEYELFRKQAR